MITTVLDGKLSGADHAVLQFAGESCANVKLNEVSFVFVDNWLL